MRTKSGSKYPASTVYMLLSELLRHMRFIVQIFFDTKDARFKGMHAINDTYFWTLREDGVRAEVKHADIVSKEEENALWEQGVFGVDFPLALLGAVLFYNGKKSVCVEGKSTVHLISPSLFLGTKSSTGRCIQRMGGKIGVAVCGNYT